MDRLADLTWEQASRRRVLLIPVGSTEQHGPHLPLSTDTDIAVAIARRGARLLGESVVAPEVAYGSSGEHQAFPGTLSIGREATETLVVELVRSASRSFRQLVLVSTHGGNLEPLRRATDRLGAEGHELLLWSPPWHGDAHAGRLETSVMLAIDPSRVTLELAAAGNTAPLDQLLDQLRERGVADVSPNGVLGDPAGASAAEGERLLGLAADDLARAVRERECVASRS